MGDDSLSSGWTLSSSYPLTPKVVSHQKIVTVSPSTCSGSTIHIPLTPTYPPSMNETPLVNHASHNAHHLSTCTETETRQEDVENIQRDEFRRRNVFNVNLRHGSYNRSRSSILLHQDSISLALRTYCCKQSCLSKYGKRALLQLHQKYVQMNKEEQNHYLAWSIRPRDGLGNSKYEYSFGSTK